MAKLAAMRRVAALVFALLLSACGRGEISEPFGESATPPSLASRFYPPEGWAWGFVQARDWPAQRYGVVAAEGRPRARVLILPGFGESAEAWFETADQLSRSGSAVWILDRAGQGGSGRFAAPRDLGHAPSFAPDAETLDVLAARVIPPDPLAPLILIAHADAAAVALGAVQDGLAADALVLSSPRLAPETLAGPLETFAGRIGLSRLAVPAPGWTPWTRGGPDAAARGLTHDPWRGAVQHAWALANPDLRMTGPSLGWRAAFAQAGSAARAGLGRVRAPVLIAATAGDGGSRAICSALPDCRLVEIAGAGPALHLERDTQRDHWLREIEVLIAEREARAKSVVADHAR